MMLHVVLSVNRNETSDYLADNCVTVSMIVPRHVLKGDCDTLVSCKEVSFTNMLHRRCSLFVTLTYGGKIKPLKIEKH